MINVLDFVKRLARGAPTPVPLATSAYIRTDSDQQQRLSLQRLTAEQFVAAQDQMNEGNPVEMARINDAMLQTDPQLKAALKQLKTAIGGVEFVLTPPNDSDKATEIADELRVDLDRKKLNLRALKGWMLEHRVRGGGLIDAVWNEPTEKHRTWDRFVVVPQQRFRFNRMTGEPQFASTPFQLQGTDVSKYPAGKWIVVSPDQHIADYSLRGVVPALLNDWFGRLNTMGWWNQSLERDAMKTLVGKAASQQDSEALEKAFRNRGAAGSFLLRDPNSNVSALEGTLSRSGVSPYAEYMTHTAQRMFLALLGESQTGIIEKEAGSKQSADTQHEIAKYVIEDICQSIAFIAERDLFVPWVKENYGEQNLENTPSWEPKLDEPVDVVKLNEAISTRPANVALGTNWYRHQTQWPEPLTGEEPLDKPMPMPGQYPSGGAKPPDPEEKE